MELTKNELNLLKENSLSVQNAKDLAKHIESDHTLGGIFPEGNAGDFSNPNEELFSSKYCAWWPIARILLVIAKVFTGPKGDKLIDAAIATGNRVCNWNPAEN